MATSQKFFLFLLRVTTGWMFFYAGITKVLNPQWSAEGYLKGAKSFVWLYQWLLQPEILPIINSINKWGLTLLGASLIIGLFVRFQFHLGRSADGFILYSSRFSVSESKLLHCGPAHYLYRRSIIFCRHWRRQSFRLRQQACPPSLRI